MRGLRKIWCMAALAVVLVPLCAVVPAGAETLAERGTYLVNFIGTCGN